METVTVWKFDSPGGATGAAARLDTLAKEGAGHIIDGAVVEWAQSQRKARLSVFRRSAARTSALWSWLFDQVFTPAASPAPVEGAPSHIVHALAEAHIGDDTITRLRAEAVQGSSFLFLVSEPGNRERILESFGGASRFLHLLHSNLPPDEESQMRAVFTDGRDAIAKEGGV